MGNLITLKGWYQLDFKLDKPPKAVIKGVVQLVGDLKTAKLIDKWFYLFEGKTFRVRFRSSNPDELNKRINETLQEFGLTLDPEHLFEPYFEDSDMFTTPETIETFANMMAELSELTVQRANNKNLFENYKLVERLSHCVFNNVYGSDTETYFLLKRMGVNFQSKDNPEQTVIDDNQQYELTNPITMTVPSIKMPKKP